LIRPSPPLPGLGQYLPLRARQVQGEEAPPHQRVGVRWFRRHVHWEAAGQGLQSGVRETVQDPQPPGCWGAQDTLPGERGKQGCRFLSRGGGGAEAPETDGGAQP